LCDFWRYGSVAFAQRTGALAFGGSYCACAQATGALYFVGLQITHNLDYILIVINVRLVEITALAQHQSKHTGRGIQARICHASILRLEYPQAAKLTL